MRLNAVFRQEKIPQSLAALRNCDGGRYRTRTYAFEKIELFGAKLAKIFQIFIKIKQP